MSQNGKKIRLIYPRKNSKRIQYGSFVRLFIQLNILIVLILIEFNLNKFAVYPTKLALRTSYNLCRCVFQFIKFKCAIQSLRLQQWRTHAYYTNAINLYAHELFNEYAVDWVAAMQFIVKRGRILLCVQMAINTKWRFHITFVCVA